MQNKDIDTIENIRLLVAVCLENVGFPTRHMQNA